MTKQLRIKCLIYIYLLHFYIFQTYYALSKLTNIYYFLKLNFILNLKKTDIHNMSLKLVGRKI